MGGSLLVIPVETGIYFFQGVMDTRLRGYDDFLRVNQL